MVSRERASRPRRSVILLPAVVSLWLGCPAAKAQAPPVTLAERERFEALVEQRRQLDETVWANEQLAQRYEATFVALWDDLLLRPDKYATLAGFPFQTLRLGALQGRRAAGSGVTILDFGAAGRSLDHRQWKAFIEKMRDEGYRIEQTEWHHSRFEPGGTDPPDPPSSEVRFVIHASHSDGPTRYEIEGTLKVRWSSEADERGNPVAEAIDATDLLIKQRSGDPPFTEMFRATVDALDAQADVLVFDLDNDGRSEIAYPAGNLVFWNSGAGRFQQDELCRFPAKIVYEAAFADFTGDGHVDLLCAGSNAIRRRPDMRFTLFLYAGDGRGRFVEAPTRAVPAEISFEVPETMAIGDIDADGDLDVWLGQYRAPYGRGQFPKPYYDANDGLPAYLLLNAGDGHFVDATVESGLAPKRFRRIFRSSFVDLDDDGDLDLLVVSDFAGIDVYFNDGRGRFQDVTDRVVDEWMNFGMSHTFSDFNTDGRLDLYVTGMASTTARRLHRMGLGPSDQPDYQAARVRIGYGNRLYLGTGSGRFEQPTWGHLVARSGASFEYHREASSRINVMLSGSFLRLFGIENASQSNAVLSRARWGRVQQASRQTSRSVRRRTASRPFRRRKRRSPPTAEDAGSERKTPRALIF